MLELYFKYRRVIARLRRGALGNEVDRIAADLSGLGYKRDSAKLYLARIAHFSATQLDAVVASRRRFRHRSSVAI